MTTSPSRQAARFAMTAAVDESLLDLWADMDIDDLQDTSNVLVDFYDDPLPEQQRRLQARNKMRLHVRILGRGMFLDLVSSGLLDDVIGLAEHIEALERPKKPKRHKRAKR